VNAVVDIFRSVKSAVSLTPTSRWRFQVEPFV